jgi:hypothetical protein
LFAGAAVRNKSLVKQQRGVVGFPALERRFGFGINNGGYAMKAEVLAVENDALLMITSHANVDAACKAVASIGFGGSITYAPLDQDDLAIFTFVKGGRPAASDLTEVLEENKFTVEVLRFTTGE